MATQDHPAGQSAGADTGIVEMSWDPITRIVGSLGIYTKIDFGQRKVVECHTTPPISGATASS